MILLGDADCRLKASLERLQRLTQSYADAMIQIFPERASQLGQALGLDQAEGHCESPTPAFLYSLWPRSPWLSCMHKFPVAQSAMTQSPACSQALSGYSGKTMP